MNQSYFEAVNTSSGERSGDERLSTVPYFAVRWSTLRVSILGECQICLIGGEPRRPPSQYIWNNRTKTLAGGRGRGRGLWTDSGDVRICGIKLTKQSCRRTGFCFRGRDSWCCFFNWCFLSHCAICSTKKISITVTQWTKGKHSQKLLHVKMIASL